jgi:hypothetical protein
MDQELWDMVQYLLSCGWKLTLANPYQGAPVEIETPSSVRVVDQPFAIFYQTHQEACASGDTLAAAIDKACAIAAAMT